jgi:hypothetical protein
MVLFVPIVFSVYGFTLSKRVAGLSKADFGERHD